MKTIRRLTLENFQSHEFTSLDLAPGLNVIVGPSDQGKSAIIRALRWLFLNEPRGTDMIRIGATGPCRVTVEYTDGTRVTRERSSSRNRYELQLPGEETQVFEGFGGQVPEEIMGVTGVRPLPLDDASELLLHLANQLEGPFLLSETGAFRAKAIGRLNGVYVLDAALRDTNTDLVRKRSEEKQVADRLAEVDERLTAFADLPDLEQRLAAVEAKLAAVQAAEQQLARLAGLARAWQEINQALEAVDAQLTSLGDLSRAEATVLKAVSTGQQLERLRRLASQERRTEADLQQTEVFLDRLGPAAAFDLGQLEQQVQRWGRLVGLAQAEAQVQHNLVRVEAWLTRLNAGVTAEPKVSAAVEAAQRLPRLRQLALQAAKGQQLLDRMNWGLERLQHLAEAEALVRATEALPQRLAGVRRLAQTLALWREEAELATREEARLAAEVHRLAAEYQTKLEQLGRCPTCLQPIVGVHIDDLVAATREEE